MARKTVWSEAKIAGFIAEGRGKGAGADYKPWIEVHDMSSLGKSRRIHSQKTQRTHHLLSDVEWGLFLLLEHSGVVQDIREQYPLNRDKTMSIAAELGIKHPVYPGTNIPVVMTCDFLVTFEENGMKTVRAFNCKSKSGVDSFRELEKLEIARAYFDRFPIPHHLVFDSELPKNKVKNLEWCRGASVDGNTHEHFDSFAEHRQRIINAIALQRNGNVQAFCQYQDECAGVETGSSLRVVRSMLWHRELLTDLNIADITELPLSMFRLSADIQPQVRGAA